MKNYLSFGGGVNSVAMYLLLLEQGVDFEAVFVDHGTDWPETYEYIDMFKKMFQLTILRPKDGILYDYCWEKRMVPGFMRRWCTDKFKIRPLLNYYKKPCFQMIGIDYGERNRAKISTQNNVERRYPLIEADINRRGCIDIINRFGLPIPRKSGCFICPFQSVGNWSELRREHPDLFCKAEQLEQRNIEYLLSKGKKPWYLSPRKTPLRAIVDEDQMMLFEQDEYPPCECML